MIKIYLSLLDQINRKFNKFYIIYLATLLNTLKNNSKLLFKVIIGILTKILKFK